MNYRSYKHDRGSLINKLTQENFANNDDSFQRFRDISLATLNRHTPCKIKHVQGNQMLFFDKEISKATMTRTKLCNNFPQNEKEENRKLRMQNKETFVSLF